MLMSDKFHISRLVLNYWIIGSCVIGLCEDECKPIDKYSLACNKVIQTDLQDCHKKFSEISTLRLNWYGLNYSFVDQRDFYAFSNLSNILIEPSNATGFSSRLIKAEEYENPNLWTTYESIVFYGRVLHVRLFSAFVKESCCSKWLSRIVLANLLSSEITIPWFKRCFAGFNLFCQSAVEKPPISTIMAWIESVDEFKEILEKYCTFKGKSFARFKRLSLGNQEQTLNDGQTEKERISGGQVLKTIYKYKHDGRDESFNNRRSELLSKHSPDYEDPKEMQNNLEFYRIASIVLAVACIVLLTSFSVVSCLYCRVRGVMKSFSYDDNPVQDRWQYSRNAGDSDTSVDRRQSVIQPPPTYQPAPSNNNNYIAQKQNPKHRQDVNKKDDNKFVKGLKNVFALRNCAPDPPINQSEREKLVSHGVRDDRNNNNMTSNINSSNSAIDQNKIDVRLKINEENIDLSDEEELQQIFLDHLYNSVRSHSRFSYHNRLDEHYPHNNDYN